MAVNADVEIAAQPWDGTAKHAEELIEAAARLLLPEEQAKDFEKGLNDRSTIRRAA